MMRDNRHDPGHDSASDSAGDSAGDSPEGPLRNLLRQTAPIRFDAGFEERVMARLASKQARRAPSSDETLATVGRRWLPWLAAAAALLAMVDWRASVGNRREPTAALVTASEIASEIASETGAPNWSAYQ